MNVADVIEKLSSLGQPGYKKILMNHGVVEPVFGVKIEELKKIQKQVKTDYQLALGLYDTGIYDAMYLAGLIVDQSSVTKKDLQHWVNNATCPMLTDYKVPWVAAESGCGLSIALE